MKKTILTAIGGFALLFAILFVGCQQEDQVSPDNKLTYRARPGSLPPDNCLPNNPTWTFNDPCPGEDLTVTVCFNADCGQAQIQYESAPGVWDQVASENPLIGSCLTATITDAAAGTYNFRTAYQSSGNDCNFCAVHFAGAGEHENSHNSTTVEVCDEGCDDELDLTCSDGGCGDHELTVTFTAGAAGTYTIQGGINASAVICSESSSKGTLVPFGNPNDASVRRLVVDLVECEEVTIVIGWTGGSNTGNWSSKIGGVPVGGECDGTDGCPTGYTRGCE